MVAVYNEASSARLRILETYKSFGSILKMATNENIQNAKNSLVLGKYLSAFVYQITQGNLLAYTKDVKSKEYEKITILLKSIYPSAIYIEKLGKMDMSNNTMSIINALNNFAKLDLANNATTVLKNSIIFDRALSRIDQALTKNKKARLAAMKEFSAGAVQMAESIDKVSKSVSNITNKDKQDLEFVINQLKEIEKTRLEETTIKLEYERAKEANLAQQTTKYANQVQADNKEFASNILNKTNNVQNNITQGMLGSLSQEHLDVIVKYFSDEITQAIITGLTTGIKKFELIFKNSSEVIGGQLAIGK